MHIVVIGAGLIGVTSAYHLRRAGHEVTVLERAPLPASGASFANGGMLTPSMADPWNAPGVWRDLLRWIGRPEAPMLLRAHALPALAGWGMRFIAASSAARFAHNTGSNLRLAAYSVAGMPQLRRDENLAYDSATVGTLKIYRDRHAFEQGMKKSDLLAQAGVIANVLSADEVVNLEPGLSDIAARLAGGLHFPGDESGDASMFTQELTRAAQLHGVRFRFSNDALEIVRSRSPSRVTGVRTGAETLRADAVVVAAGAHTPGLLARFGMTIPIYPVKGYSLTCAAANPAAAKPPLSLPVVDDALHAAITPLGDRLRIAGTAEFCGFDTSIDAARLHNLQGLARDILPGQADAWLSGTVVPWAGLRPMTSDGVPCIGALDPAGLYVNSGHGHLGWTMADGSARLLADLIAGEVPALDPADYSPRRF